MNSTSISLIERACRESDSDSWARLVDVYVPLIRHWLGRFDVQNADVDDLVQDVLAVVARELPQFEHNERPGAFRKWLRTILKNRLRDFWRSQQYRPVATGRTSTLRRIEQLADDASQVSRLWDQEHDEFVMKRLMTLVEPQFDPTTWAVFRRQVIDGRAPKSVADELGVSLNSVYLAKSRVLNALRREAAGIIN